MTAHDRLQIRTFKDRDAWEAKTLTFDIGVHTSIDSLKQFIEVSYGIEVNAHIQSSMKC